MKVQGKIKIGGKQLEKGSEIPWRVVYPFFMLHMLGFGGSGFFMAYSDSDVPLSFLYIHGGFAIFIYTIFYFAIFGVDQVKWMFINAGLGYLGLYSQIDWLLNLFGRQVDDFSAAVHVIPFLYYVLYTFLLRQAVLDIFHARENPARQRIVEFLYVSISLAFYLSFWFRD